MDRKNGQNNISMEQDGLTLSVRDVEGTLQSEERNGNTLIRRITLKCSPWKSIQSTFVKLILVFVLYLLIHNFVTHDTTNSEESIRHDNGYFDFVLKRVSLLSISFIMLVFYIIYCLLTSVVEESMTILRGKGIQLEKKVFYGSKTRILFIPVNDIKFVAINEGFHIDCVIFYFTIVLTRPYDGKLLMLPFDTWYPRLQLLKIIYLKSKELLNSPSTSVMNTRKP